MAFRTGIYPKHMKHTQEKTPLFYSSNFQNAFLFPMLRVLNQKCQVDDMLLRFSEEMWTRFPNDISPHILLSLR